MNHIVKQSYNCSGCTACINICNVSAITMVKDEEGFNIPYVDLKKCVNCGICVNACPTNSNNNKLKVNHLAFAFQNLDKNILKNSSSGAFFPAVAANYINNDGYVCGCVLNDSLMPEHILTKNIEDIYKMQDSKYVQSDISNCFKAIGELLLEGEKVLFSGTSCQIAGLKNFLWEKKIDFDNLFCIDFFCHGVPSPLIWREYISLYEEEKHTKVTNFRFRNKKYGWGKKSRGTYHLNTVTRDAFLWKKDNISLLSRMWYSIFFSNLCLRRYCYSCPYASLEKPSDITMADFWGIEDICYDFRDGKGCSLIISHNDAGNELIRSLNNVAHIKSVELRDAIKFQTNAFQPSKEPENRKLFWSDYKTYGFKFVAKKYFRYDTIHMIMDILHRFAFELHLTNLYK